MLCRWYFLTGSVCYKITKAVDLTCDLDIHRAKHFIIKHFNGLYCKFNFSECDMLAYLFRTFTSSLYSFYGLEPWFYNTKKKNLYKICVAYHKAIQIISFPNVWDTNLSACSNIIVYILCLQYAKRMTYHVVSLFNSDSQCMNYLGL